MRRIDGLHSVAEMVQNPLDDGGLLNAGDHPQLPAALAAVRVPGTIRARSRLAGANTPWYVVKWAADDERSPDQRTTAASKSLLFMLIETGQSQFAKVGSNHAQINTLYKGGWSVSGCRQCLAAK
jgi:hypothetical protein